MSLGSAHSLILVSPLQSVRCGRRASTNGFRSRLVCQSIPKAPDTLRQRLRHHLLGVEAPCHFLHCHGYVGIGDCFDTPRFAVETITHWWQCEGYQRYRRAKRLLILADAGGSNSCRSRVWKARLQEQLCDTCGLAVTVCRYPSGCSKWNPIQHRLFSHISLNLAGKPLWVHLNLVTFAP